MQFSMLFMHFSFKAMPEKQVLHMNHTEGKLDQNKILQNVNKK